MSKNPPIFRQIGSPLEVPDEALTALGDQLWGSDYGEA
jgi:hypothetical protein